MELCIHLAWVLCFFVLIVHIVKGVENYQRWSEHAYIGDSHVLSCIDTVGKIEVTSSDTLQWTKRGHNTTIQNDDLHFLRERNGVPNMELVILQVTEQSSGIYICNVTDMNRRHVGRIIRGLNIDGALYDKLTTKYRGNIIVAFFAAFIVFAILSGSCFIFNLEYCSAEQRARRRRLHEEEDAQQRRLDEMGVVNYGLTSSGSVSHVSGSRSWLPPDPYLTRTEMSLQERPKSGSKTSVTERSNAGSRGSFLELSVSGSRNSVLELPVHDRASVSDVSLRGSMSSAREVCI